MKRWLILASFFSGLLFISSSPAILDLELTQGIAATTPIAIVPFRGVNLVAPGNVPLTQIIQQDLQNSGEFRVVNNNEGNQNAEDYSFWRNQKIDNVLTGNVQSLGSNRYQVKVQLTSVYNSALSAATKDNVLFNQSFIANAAGLRTLAHHISDAIYHQLIGIPGIFSTKLAYILVQHSLDNKETHYRLMVADQDGFNPQTLLVSAEPIMSPAWSSDGSKIAYVSFEKKHAAIYLQDLATGNRDLISHAPGINGAPAFSPDGKKMALVLSTTGNPKIYLLDLATHALTALTSGWSIDTEPSFSRDGKTLFFTSNRDGQPQIYRFSMNNGSVTRLTYEGDYNAHASLSTEEHRMVMMHRENGLFGIARQDFSNNQLQILTQTGVDESPSLSPNGKMIIYATEYGGRGVLAQISIDGRIKLRLPASEGSVQEPAWSPFFNNLV